MYFSTTLILLLVVVNILVYCLQKLQHKDCNIREKNDSSSSLLKQRSMASSSSSSQLIHAPVPQSWKHEVFLSFRGEDTRKTFVDHLYEALKQQGIQTYKDDETLDRGETVRPALLKAIQESQIAVIVFSKNYADSSWCLDELEHIIECMDKTKLIVIPIFYDVDPSDVRKQNGKYGEAFTKYKCENKQKVDLWREALVKADNISGLVPKDFANGHEAQCIKSIVATISSRLSPLHTNVNKNLIGIETRLQHLKSMLEIESGGVRMVGIWGVGGAGKTTLASAAYMEISRQFEACCFLENIREETNKNGLTKLQEKFLSVVAKTNEAIGSEMEGRSMIERNKQLEALVGAYEWFGEGSRIIITTRDKRLLTLKNATIYEVSLLSNDEALKLFSRHAFQKDEPVEDYKTLSQEVVSYARRLPLALEILGSSLYGQDKEVWKCTLAKLKCIPDTEVMERLKISFDGLKHEEKELFLDIACFMRRWKINGAMRVLDACSFHPGIGVNVLVQKSLIKVSDGRFEMHDLIEEMAHYIVREERPNNPPEKLSRIWKREDMDNLCVMGAAVLETEVIVLLWDYWGSKSIYDNHPRLLDVIGNMKKLRWIEWENYPASSFPSNFQPTNLCYLMLRGSKLKQLWEGNKILPNLKMLDLSFSKDLMTTPDFNDLPRLERLILMLCESLEEIHPSIGYHESLVFVDMRKCQKLKTFPPITRMKKLETLNFSSCRGLYMFPDIQTNMDSLVNLHMDETGIELVPPSVGQFCTNLVLFDLQKCCKLQRIEGNFRLLKRLKYLKISGCIKLEKLEGDFFGDECCLEELPQFPCLSRKLDLSRCDLGDGDMPSDISGYTNLQILDLSGNNFSRLHSSLSKIPCLKYLNVSFCWNLVELPDLPSSIAILIAEYCDRLQSVGDLSNCKWLWKVSFEGSYKLIGVEKLVDSMVERNAVIEDRFMSMRLPRVNASLSPYKDLMRRFQLPHNWYNDFSGFLLSAKGINWGWCKITIKQEEMLSMVSQPDHHHLEEFDKNPESYKKCGVVGYVPFASSRRHTSLWNNPKYTHITFEFGGLSNPKVGLVRRKSKSRETPIHYYSHCWEEVIGDEKTFQIIYDTNSSEIEIKWSPTGY